MRHIVQKYSGFGQKNPYCKDVLDGYKWACLLNVTVDVMPLDTGEWVVYGPYDSRWYQEHTVMGIPVVHNGGPIVVGRQLRRKILINPQYALTHLLIDLDLRIDKVMPICYRYTSTLRKGWAEWIKGSRCILTQREKRSCGNSAWRHWNRTRND